MQDIYKFSCFKVGYNSAAILNIFEAIGLGILQGLTEFLPISSSGHLVIMESLLKARQTESVLFEVMLHLATLLAVVCYYRQTFSKIILHLLAVPRQAQTRGWKNTLWNDPTGKLFSMLFIACIPTAIMGLLFKDQIESLFNQPQLVGVALLITGFLLLSTKLQGKNELDILRLTIIYAIIIGIAQGIALVPGISRSGITISVALLLGVERRLSADFSFLLSVPAILGAVALTLKDIKEIELVGLIPLISGFIAASFTGYIAISVLVKIIRHGKFYLFAPYCFLLGIFVIYYFSR